MVCTFCKAPIHCRFECSSAAMRVCAVCIFDEFEDVKSERLKLPSRKLTRNECLVWWLFDEKAALKQSDKI